jgi:hypothetical protein
MEQNDEVTPMELVAAFARCSNYPRDSEGILMLAQGLKRASTASGVAMEAIVRRCTESSVFCPTDFDLFKVAEELKVESAPKAPMGCELCKGSGWQSFQKHVDPLNDGIGYMADYAKPCSCDRGRWMDAERKRRKAEADAKKGKKEMAHA